MVRSGLVGGSCASDCWFVGSLFSKNSEFRVFNSSMGKVAVQILVLGFHALFLSVYSAMGNSLFDGDAQVLISMKSAIIDPEAALKSWGVSDNGTHCSWAGIQCNHLGLVMALDLSSMNLSGPIPSHVTSLLSLRSLNLSNNVFNGSLPPNISNLRGLESLDVYNNNMSGPLPVELIRLPNLRYLNLGGNFFYGSIPTDYGLFHTLEHLALYGNDLDGRIPKELGNLSSLKFLYLGYYNTFMGGIPPELGNLTELVLLDISNCGLDGPIPSELGRLKKLGTLFLHTNALSGPIPPQLGELESLKSLDLSFNELSGEIPNELAELKELRLLNLFMNKLHGTIPSFIGDLPNLEVLQLWKNNLRGPMPQQLGRSGNLVLVDISSNKLTGAVPPDLCKGGKLQILIILNNLFFGSIPGNLGACESLVRVRMGQNYLNGSIPAGLLYLPSLNMIELNYNYLSGSIPDRAGNFDSPLGQINLSNNHLTGSLPPSIGRFSSLQILLVNGNRLSGVLPPEIGNLTRISKMDLSDNRFSGSIPAEIGRCRALTYVDFSLNHFRGSMPVEITALRILNYMNVSRNLLNSTIPREFGNMRSLSSVDFSYNNFSGVVPTGGQFSYFNASTFAGNPGLCGLYLGPCSPLEDQSRVRSEERMKGASFKLAIALGLLFCSVVVAVGTVIKAMAIRRDRDARSWKMTAFQKLDFGKDDVLESLKEDNFIGKGGAGIVYRGIMPKGEDVAIKKLVRMGSGGATHDHGFSAEIQTLGRIRHRHIVRLLAFCSNHDTNLLVYEYMPNGSLGELLHGSKGGHLHWNTRYKIALEAAKGLCYLHHDCSPLIIHRDVKSNNILLDSNFEAHVADFGLAKFLQDSGSSECMSAIAGSYGYIAPEYAYTLKVDEKSDVYSFGVVLLELITGRKPVGDFGEGVDIVQWVKKTADTGREGVTKILDSRLSSVPLEEAMHLFFIAHLCVEEQSVQRPTMRDVVQMLAECPKTKPTEYFSPQQHAQGKESKKPVSAQLKESRNSFSTNPPDLLSTI